MTDAFKAEELPEDFATKVRALLDAAAASEDRDAKAVRELSGLGAPAVDPLNRALADERQAVRLLAAQALCEIGDERALMPLISFLFVPDRPLPVTATQRQKVGTREVIRTPIARAIPQLREFLFTMARKGHGFCILILAGEADDPAALEMLESEHWGERKAAVGLLRQWGKLTDTQRDKALADPHVAVRHAAVGSRHGELTR